VELLIVRHGIAQDRDVEGVRSDADRALTDKGKKRTRQVARGLRAIGVCPDLIATSPYRRSEETARILVDELRPRSPLATCDFLTPGASVGPLVDWLCSADADVCMVVGHMPDVADLTASLLHRGGGIDVTFKKAAVCCISFDETPAEGGGCLEWLLQPGQLRALAGKRARKR
jgi:phosphohistidine phosphatase